MYRFLLFSLFSGTFAYQGAESWSDGKGCSGTRIVTCTGPEVTAVSSDYPATMIRITFDDTNVGTIPENAFVKYTALISIEFKFNSLRIIHKHAFSGLPSLSLLSLSSNELTDSSFETGAFEGLLSLREVFLNDNLLTTFPLHLFVNAKMLEVFEARKNKISNMGPASSVNLPKITSIDLRINKLQSVDASMFAQMPSLKSLYFDFNQISGVENGEVFNELPLQKILLDQNQLLCNCEAVWMVTGRVEGKPWAMEWGNDLECASPKWMKTRNIADLYVKDLACEKPTITPTTSINISLSRQTAFSLKATMDNGLPYSTWMAPDGTTEIGQILMEDDSQDIQHAYAHDEIKTDHSVETTLDVKKYFDMTGMLKFTLIATNAKGKSEQIFLVNITPSGAVGGPPVYTSTLLLMLLSTWIITQ